MPALSNDIVSIEICTDLSTRIDLAGIHVMSYSA